MTSKSSIVTIEDVRKLGYCASGARRWFESYGFDFRDFLKNGISIDQFLSTNDVHAHRIVNKIRERDRG